MHPPLRQLLLVVASCGVALLFAVAPARVTAEMEIEVEETEAPHPVAQAALYRQYSGACHGPRAPIDLTTIQRNFEADFPRYLVVMSVDGRDTVRAHGASNMPVWGEVFAEEFLPDPAAKARARGQVMKIVDYVESIQR